MTRPTRLALLVGILTLCVGALSASAQPGTAEPPARRTMHAVRMADGDQIQVDGRLDEPIWQRATPATDFIQFDPDNGKPATERTEVRIAYSRTAFYMGVTCHDDEPDRLLRFQRRRDEGLPSDDRLMWVIDPFLTSQNGYFFETNPSGLMGDALLTPAGQNRQWDGVWTLRVQRTDIGWTFEVEIPFSTLNFDPGSTQWGINFQRTVRRKNEESLWFGWARNQGLQRLSNTGLVDGLNEDVSQGHGLDLRPYVLTSAGVSPVTGQPGTNTTTKAGLDTIYSITPGLRANFTINTDFAQTDVDARQVNLTQASLFFPEKRTFFLEGASLFDFGTVPNTGGGGGGGFSRPVDNALIPFFSRRIGLDSANNAQKVDYGVKMFGQVGRNDLGVLHMRTGVDSDFTACTSPGRPAGCETPEDFSVIRIKRRMFRQSYVGAMYTLRAPHVDGASTLQTEGIDFLFATSRFRGSKQLFFGGYFLHATNPADDGRNNAYALRVDYPNDRWNAGMLYRTIQARFNPAVGFVQLQKGYGYQQYNPYLNFSPRPAASRWVRRYGFTADVLLQTDTDNRFLSRLWTLTVFNADLHSLDTLSVLVLPEYERLAVPFTLRSGPATSITLPAGNEYNFVRYRFTAQTANRRVFALNPIIELGDFYSGTRTQLTMNETIRARPGLIVYVGQDWNRINLAEGRFETRVFSMTPELQFSQWIALVNTVQYDSVSRVLGWQSRFRWILKPGNDLFIVYTQNSFNDRELGRYTTVNKQGTAKFVYMKRF